MSPYPILNFHLHGLLIKLGKGYRTCKGKAHSFELENDGVRLKDLAILQALLMGWVPFPLTNHTLLH